MKLVKKILLVAGLMAAAVSSNVTTVCAAEAKSAEDKYYLPSFRRAEWELAPTASMLDGTAVREWKAFRAVGRHEFAKSEYDLRTTTAPRVPGNLMFIKVTWEQVVALHRSGISPYQIGDAGMLVEAIKSGYPGPMLVGMDNIPGFVVKSKKGEYVRVFDIEDVVKGCGNSFWLVLDTRDPAPDAAVASK